MKLLQQYRIVKILKESKSERYNTVYLIEHKETFEKFILKSGRKINGQGLSYERLANESMYDFNFEGLPRIIHVEKDDENIVLITQYMAGETLSEYLKKIKKKDYFKVIHQIIKALKPIFEHLRNNHIVHCDIKESNILVEESKGELKLSLIDFGLAIKQENIENRKLIFPLGYAAPELILNHLKIVNHTSDLFSLGIIIWKIFNGKLPLLHPNPCVFTNLQITHPLPSNSAIPKNIAPIISKMCFKHSFSLPPNQMHYEEVEFLLKKAQENRYQNIDEVINAFDQIPEKTSLISRILYGNRYQS